MHGEPFRARRACGWGREGRGVGGGKEVVVRVRGGGEGVGDGEREGLVGVGGEVGKGE